MVVMLLLFGWVGDDQGREGSGPERLLRVLGQRAGCGHELVQVFVALGRAIGTATRPDQPQAGRLGLLITQRTLACLLASAGCCLMVAGLQVRYVCPLFPISYLNPPYLRHRKKQQQQGKHSAPPRYKATGRSEQGEDDVDEDEEEEGEPRGQSKRREEKTRKRRRRSSQGKEAKGQSRRRLLQQGGRDGGCGGLVWAEVSPPANQPS